jgi:hypothetical protein
MAGGWNIVARVHTWVHQKHIKTDFLVSMSNLT